MILKVIEFTGGFKQEWHHRRSKTTVGVWEEMIEREER